MPTLRRAKGVSAATRKIAASEKYVDRHPLTPTVQDGKLNSGFRLYAELSPREFEVFLMLVSGQRLTQIADTLSLSVKTVSTHKTHIFRKMGMTNVAELVRYAVAHRLGK